MPKRNLSDISRREWLAQAATAVGTVSFAAMISPARLLAATAATVAANHDRFVFSFDRAALGLNDKRPLGKMVIWERAAGTFTDVAAEGYVHSFAALPHDPALLLGVGKRNGFVGILDLKRNLCSKSFTPTPGFSPNGHFAFSPDGKELFIAQVETNTKIGSIEVRDARTFRVVRTFPSYGKGPHELKFDPEGKTLLVANFSGSAPFEACSLAWIDPRSGKLLKRFDANRPANGGHFTLTKDGWVVLGAVSFAKDIREIDRDGLIWVIDPQGKSSWLKAPPEHAKQFLGEASAIAVREDLDIVYAISRSGGGLLSWNFRTGAFTGHWLGAGSGALMLLGSPSSEIIATQAIDSKTTAAMALAGPKLEVSAKASFTLESYIPSPHVFHQRA